MALDKNLFAQVFTGVITIILLVTFYMLLITDLIQGSQNSITPMILIIIAVILLAIYAMINKIFAQMQAGQSKKK